MFLSEKTSQISKKSFKKRVSELLDKFPTPKNSYSSTDKSKKFKEEAENLKDLLTKAKEKFSEIKDLAKEHFDKMHMYSEMIELTVPKDRGSMRSRFRSESKKFNQTIDKANRLAQTTHNPYFGRIDFEFSEETTNPDYRNKTVSFYIGKKGTKIKNKKITDWRAPISSIYYNFPKPANDCFYKTDDKVINGNLKLKRKIEIDNAALQNVYDGEELTSLVGSDPFLLKQLNQKASSQLKDIISTIQSEQNKIISLEPDKDIIVQGVAGSGKTSIAIHRLSWLLYNYKNIDAKNCLIIAPTKLFLKYIKNLLPEIGSENVPQSTFNDWAIYKLRDVIDEDEIIKPPSDTTSQDYKYDDDEAEKTTIKFMKFIEKIARKYKTKNIKPSEILDIYKSRCQTTEINYSDLAPLLYLKTLLRGVRKNEEIDYLVVDEAQDCSPAQILTLKKFADTGRSMFVGDLLQGIINSNGVDSWEELIEQIFDPQKVEFFRIRTSYRSTKSIVEFVNRRLKNNSVPSNLLPRPVLRQGEKVISLKERDIDEIIKKIKARCRSEIDKGRKNIGIIIPEKFTGLFSEELKKEFTDITILDEKTKYDGGIALGHVRIFKGLEFDSIILVNMPETHDQNLRNKNFYVSCTRAMHTLYVIDTET